MRDRILLISGLFVISCGSPGNVDVEEFEPNDAPGQAKSIGTPVPPIRVGAAISPPGDVDFFKFTIPATADVKLETFDKFGVECKNVDTRLELIAPNGSTILAQNDDVIPFENTCSVIDPATEANAQALAPGDYFAKVVAVNETVTIPSYQLRISFSALCGDSAQNGSEACDDGNLTNNDGCSAACEAELCGNSIIDAGEDCDDGKQCDDLTTSCTDELGCVGIGDESCAPRNGDGCSTACQDENNLAVCGNGIEEDNEQCDDGNTNNNDGCSANCIVENPECGNNIIEDNEECEDGNTSPGDGCNANCLNEPGHFGELEPNDGTDLFEFKDIGVPPVIIHGALTPASDIDVYRFTVQVTADIRVEVFDGENPPNSCNGVDSAIELLASDGETLLASDDENSDAFCSIIDAGSNASASGILPGEYFLRIREFGEDEVVPDYQVQISFNALCGNNQIEGSEECDDGNLIPEDGCNQNCKDELVGAVRQFFEVEPNDVPGSLVKSIDEPNLAPTLIHGVFNPIGDSDVYQFFLPPGETISFETFGEAGPSGGCLGLDTALFLFGPDGLGGFDNFLINGAPVGDDDGGELACSRLVISEGVIPSNVYQVQVIEFGNDDLGDYTIEVTLP